MFYIWSYDHKEKEVELEKLILEKLEPHLRKLPYFKSVNTYKRRVGLGQRPLFQTWIEISDLSAVDKWIEHIKAPNTEWKEIGKLFHSLISNHNTSIFFRVKVEPRML